MQPVLAKHPGTGTTETPRTGPDKQTKLDLVQSYLADPKSSRAGGFKPPSLGKTGSFKEVPRWFC